MADNVRIELNLPGINALMTSEEFAAKIREAASEVASSANSMSDAEYGYSVKKGRWVVVGNVFPDSKKAANDNYLNNTLEKAVGSSGLHRRKGD